MKSQTFILKYSKLKILRSLSYAVLYGAIGILFCWLFYKAYEKGYKFEFNATEFFFGMIAILCLFFASLLIIKWLPCLFGSNSAFLINDKGVTFKPNIGFFQIPWTVKSKFISWASIEEYWFHGARVLGEQSMPLGAYVICFKLRGKPEIEKINFGPLAWSYHPVINELGKYVKHAYIGGN